MRILAISGSLRRDSHNTALLRAAATLLPPGIELTLHDGLREIPPYDDDELEARPVAVARLDAEVAAADAVLISTPEYNSSIPGQLKNALDWLSRPLADSPLRNKPTAVIGRLDRHVRSGLGTGRNPQGPQRDRRPRPRHRTTRPHR